MIRGRLETLYSQGYVEGWAYDASNLARPVFVEARGPDGASIAKGLAIGYRESLARAKLAGGWCSFRLRTERPAEELRKVGLGLYDSASGERIYYADSVAYADGWAPEFEAGADGVSFDPFVIERVAQLSGLGEVFDAFIAKHGAEAFVRTGYVYILGRAADAEGLTLHLRMLGEKSLTPYGFLELLSEAQEFRMRPRNLAAPKAAAFPFGGGDHVR